mmetsp:Transcript_86117/g.229828  ORF Transcript_86117/g.229828 Transcript_86117/m.229828 type:complete len:241 (-) Transcript_86117:184-906(-)
MVMPYWYASSPLSLGRCSAWYTAWTSSTPLLTGLMVRTTTASSSSEYSHRMLASRSLTRLAMSAMGTSATVSWDSLLLGLSGMRTRMRCDSWMTKAWRKSSHSRSVGQLTPSCSGRPSLFCDHFSRSRERVERIRRAIGRSLKRVRSSLEANMGWNLASSSRVGTAWRYFLQSERGPLRNSSATRAASRSSRLSSLSTILPGVMKRSRGMRKTRAPASRSVVATRPRTSSPPWSIYFNAT